MWLRERATLAEEGEIKPATPDPDDDYLVSLALSCEADLIVSRATDTSSASKTKTFPKSSAPPGSPNASEPEAKK